MAPTELITGSDGMTKATPSVPRCDDMESVEMKNFVILLVSAVNITILIEHFTHVAKERETLTHCQVLKCAKLFFDVKLFLNPSRGVICVYLV